MCVINPKNSRYEKSYGIKVYAMIDKILRAMD